MRLAFSPLGLCSRDSIRLYYQNCLDLSLIQTSFIVIQVIKDRSLDFLSLEFLYLINEEKLKTNKHRRTHPDLVTIYGVIGILKKSSYCFLPK